MKSKRVKGEKNMKMNEKYGGSKSQGGWVQVI